MINILRKVLFSTFIAIALFLLVLNAYLYLNQSAMLFYPATTLDATPTDWGMSYESVEFELENKTKISGWYLPYPQAEKTVLFFHGNGGNISHRGDSLYIFHQLKLNVLIIDYPGYGKSSGKPSEKGLYQSANAAWHYLITNKKVRPKNIIVFGRSLGGAVAVDLASRVKAGAVILESTFSSVQDMVNRLFPLISKFIYLRYSFDSFSKINKITAPILIIHSSDDEVIPFVLGEKLYSAVLADKTFLKIEGGHNDGFMKSISPYMNALSHFTQSL
ncbi:MAG: alpha/beta hydrolase [Gammaproteobacteria bacterium]|nr:alpha/beta hydrolase [Gammaproteobacteria bacterium]